MEKDPPENLGNMTDLSEKRAAKEAKLPYDERTIFAAALVCVRQERSHRKSATDFMLKNSEAARAHSFVAMNCRHMADTIMMLTAKGFNQAKANIDVIHEELDKREKIAAKIKVVPSDPKLS